MTFIRRQTRVFCHVLMLASFGCTHDAATNKRSGDLEVSSAPFTSEFSLQDSVILESLTPP